MTGAGLIIAAPQSGAGKTSLSVGLMAALRQRGQDVRPFKCGPDYIDPQFHAAACGRPSFNLDAFAMSAATMAGIAAAAGPGSITIAEGVMGLFDAGPARGASGTGSTADIAAVTGWPVVLIIDAQRMAQTAGAIAAGCAAFRSDITVAGVILNRVSGTRHAELAGEGLAQAGLPLLGAIPAGALPSLPERHLGLVQAEEHGELAGLIAGLAEGVARHVDLGAMMAAARPCRLPASPPLACPPPGGRIALAKDAAFSFIYPHLIAGWRQAGATILPFSPLADEAPDTSADALWLPGGYPELHAGRLAAAERFLAATRRFAETRPVHGECGGYMALGEGLEDAAGTHHAMLGLLRLETSFARRRLNLGYRRASLCAPAAGYPAGARLTGHEFHYAAITRREDEPLAIITDAAGQLLPETGSRRGSVTGTFFHIVSSEA